MSQHQTASLESSTVNKRILRVKDIVTYYGTNRMQLHRWEKNDDFPKPIRLSERTKGWWRHEVEDWFESRKIFRRK